MKLLLGIPKGMVMEKKCGARKRHHHSISVSNTHQLPFNRDPKVTGPQHGSRSKEERLLSDVIFFFLVHVRVKRNGERKERWATVSVAILDLQLPPH